MVYGNVNEMKNLHVNFMCIPCAACLWIILHPKYTGNYSFALVHQNIRFRKKTGRGWLNKFIA